MDINDWFGNDDGDEESRFNLLLDRTIHTHASGWENFTLAMGDAISETLIERKFMTVIEWAEGDPEDETTGAHIPATSGQPKPGRYSSQNGPVMIEVANAFSDPEVSEITMIIGAQVGKSRTMQNMLGWAIDTAPGPITCVYPNEDMAKVKMEEDFLPSIWATPSLSWKVAPDEKEGREKGRKMRFLFPGGWIRFVSAKSPPAVKGSPAQYVFIEEHAESSGPGVPLSPDGLVRPRTTQFANWKIVRLSTPKGSAKTCPTTKEYENSDKSKPFVNCPACDHEHIMEWENVSIPRNSRGNLIATGTVYKCPSCAFAMSDAVRDMMISKVKWKQTAIHDCCGHEQNPMETRNWDDQGIHHCTHCESPFPKFHRGFWASVLYAYGIQLEGIARRWIDAQDDPAKLLEFINQSLAKTFVPAGEFTHDIVKSLQDRRLDYQSLYGPGVQVPPSCKFVLMTADVQRKDRIEFERRGWSPQNESFGIDYGIVYGDPNDPSGQVWKTLDRIRRMPMAGVNGRVYHVSRCGIDIGDNVTVKSAMKYIQPNKRLGVYALRGEKSADIFVPFDPTKTRHKYPHDVVGTDRGRELLDQRLRKWYRENEGPLTHSLPGGIHFPTHVIDEEGNSHHSYDLIDEKTGEVLATIGYPIDYFDQLTNFKLKIMKDAKRGGMKQVYEVSNTTVREEALDIMIYQFGGAESMKRLFNVGYIESIPDQYKMGVIDKRSTGANFDKFDKADEIKKREGGRPVNQVKQKKTPQMAQADRFTKSGFDSGFGVRPGMRRG